MLKITYAVGDNTGRVGINLETDSGTKVHVVAHSTYRSSAGEGLLEALSQLEHDIHEFINDERGSKA